MQVGGVVALGESRPAGRRFGAQSELGGQNGGGEIAAEYEQGVVSTNSAGDPCSGQLQTQRC